MSFLESMRAFSFPSAAFRMVLAMLAGGLVGYGRSKEGHPAGLRTYMLISIGAAMSVLITQFLYEMLAGPWDPIVQEIGLKFDASRLASQVITGIGFLGAGIILKVAHQQVNGVTTATGLFATVCMGIAAGAGYYECVIPALILIAVVLNNLSQFEVAFRRRLRNLTLNVEFDSLEDISRITELIEQQNARIFDIDVERTKNKGGKCPSAIFFLRLSKQDRSHSGMLTAVAELPCVRSAQELIS